MTETHVYKLLTDADWHVAKTHGATQTALDVDDGYVHLSTQDQVSETAQLHYKGQRDVRLLEFAIAALPEMKWEASRGGQLFPHLYAPLEIDWAARQWTLTLGEDDAPVMPEDL